MIEDMAKDTAEDMDQMGHVARETLRAQEEMDTDTEVDTAMEVEWVEEWVEEWEEI